MTDAAQGGTSFELHFPLIR